MDEKLELLYPSLSADIINLVIEHAESYVLDYCNIDEIPTALESVVLDMCKQDINKLRAEGISSESAGGSSLSYETDYTENIYRRLKKHKKIQLV